MQEEYQIDQLCRSIVSEALDEKSPCSVLYIPYDLIMPHHILVESLKEQPESMLEKLRLMAVQLQEGAVVLCARICGRTEEFVTGMSEIKASKIGRLVSIIGTVIKVGPVKSIPFRIVYSCHHCGCEFVHQITDNILSQPERCETSGCISKVFVIQRDCKNNLYRNHQKIKIQEVASIETESFRAPKTIEVELFDDITDCCNAGQIIRVFGIVKVATTADEKLVQLNSVHSLFIEANYAEVVTSHDITLRYSKDDLVAFGQSKDVFKRLLESFCPRIHGNEHVKAGILLCMLGGSVTQNELRRIRTDCHMLVVGDPGMGKSQLLCAATGLAPKGIYVCGNTSSSAGLTASITNDGEEYAVEAGALVLADRGLCCIDEFDKMAGDHRALLEVMEQQRVNVAKAGIVCSLPARASIMAAANPINGHFDPGTSIADNIKISAPLLSRFDLVFVLCDKPNERFDRSMARNVLGNTNNTNNNADDEELLEPEFLKQYIKLAKEMCNPRLTQEAALHLQSHYLECKRSNTSWPITIRYLEALIRLSEAKAKAELRGFVTVEDSQYVVELMRKSREFNMDQRQVPKPGKRHNSKSATLRRFQEMLVRVSAEKGTNVFLEDQLRSLYDRLEVQLSGMQFGELIDQLNGHGIILLSGPGKYKLLTS